MLKRFLKQRRAVAALEFVLVAPVLVILLFGVYDLSSALIVYQEIYASAHSMSASITNEAVKANGTNALTYTQVQQAESILWSEIPTLRGDLQDGVKSITVSSIVYELLPTITTTVTHGVTSYTYTTCTPSTTQKCNYVPVVAWSVAYMGGDSGRQFATPSNTFANGAWTAVGAPLRSCVGQATTPATIPINASIKGTLNQTLATQGASSDLTNLRTYSLSTPAPANPAPPSPIIVVDVQLNYQPVVGLFIKTAIPFWVNGYWPVRSVQVSTSQTFALSEEYVSLSPNVPASATPIALADNAAGNIDEEIYDANGSLVSTNNYCVNTTLFSTYGAAPETQ